ncbi:hypothetical protein CWS02_17325 [Enterobacter sp. EA-1]|nr:hypothetical protein CWS02_17325 [Enterobacter sp. EA-1]
MHDLTCAQRLYYGRHFATVVPALPDIRLVWCVLAFGCLLAYSQKPVLRYCGFTLLFFVWGILAAQQTLWPTRPAGGNRHVEVMLTETDNMTRHRGKFSLDGIRLYPAPRHYLLRGVSSPAGLQRATLGDDDSRSPDTWAAQ